MRTSSLNPESIATFSALAICSAVTEIISPISSPTTFHLVPTELVRPLTLSLALKFEIFLFVPVPRLDCLLPLLGNTGSSVESLSVDPTPSNTFVLWDKFC